MSKLFHRMQFYQKKRDFHKIFKEQVFQYHFTQFGTHYQMKNGNWDHLCGFILFYYFFQVSLDTVDIKLCRFKM